MELTGSYRLQLHRGFGFADAERQVAYLARLGVSHLYLSPVLESVPGSMHGYDVLDHTRISQERGGRPGLLALADTAHRHGLGVVVDVVPNHMAMAAPETANAPLWQVLAEGRAAPTAHWFDVDWDHLDGRLGLPVLGETLERTLAAGELRLDDSEHGRVVRYHDHVFPVADGTEGGGVGSVLSRQHYLLASWREKPAVLNYRRFFDVDTLLAVRVEEADVFEATHRLLLDLNHSGVVDGFRIDHPDGLADPDGYLRALRQATSEGTPVWVEKILEGDEALPGSFACEGTTGYDAVRAVQAALVDPAAAPEVDAAWARAGGEQDLAAVAEESKRLVVAELLAPEVDRLTRRAVEAASHLDGSRLRDAVLELLVAGEVYRAYIHPGRPAEGLALERLRGARDRAVAARPELTAELDHLLALAVGQVAGGPAEDFAVRLQQTWGPVMAKGVEDTTFYRWHRMVALNEVGGSPGLLADAGPGVLHAWAERQQRRWPLGMTALSTHDTKRSEDVRARLLTVAGDPASWRRCADTAITVADDMGLDRPTAHLVWQTVVGAGPVTEERLHAYLVKAVREAKQHTAWVGGDEEYERRVVDFGGRCLRDPRLRAVLDGAVEANADAVRATVLAGKLVQLTLPGVPDVYQGCEQVDLSLVDPDNRRPVDYAERSDRLARLDDGQPPRDLDDEKLLVTARALRLRRAHPEWFGPEADHAPLPAGCEHLLGFVRSGRVVCLATRAAARLERSGRWGSAGVDLPAGVWHDELTGASFEGRPLVREVLESLPVALLVRHGLPD